jgi:LacI family transcriptional regulator
MKGYLDALDHYKIKYDPGMIIQCGGDKENYKLIYDLLKGKKHPDGIFASVEKLAIDSYQVCRDLDISIPTKVKVVCYANLETASLLTPSMTTVTQPAYEMGKEASEILFRLIEKKYLNNHNQHLVFQSKLMIRDSTGKVG